MRSAFPGRAEAAQFDVFLTKLTTMAAAFSGHVLNGSGCCVASYFAATAFSVVRCGGDWKLVYGPASEALPEEALRQKKIP